MSLFLVPTRLATAPNEQYFYELLGLHDNMTYISFAKQDADELYAFKKL